MELFHLREFLKPDSIGMEAICILVMDDVCEIKLSDGDGLLCFYFDLDVEGEKAALCTLISAFKRLEEALPADS